MVLFKVAQGVAGLVGLVGDEGGPSEAYGRLRGSPWGEFVAETFRKPAGSLNGEKKGSSATILL